MDLIADILLVAGAFAAAVYCYVLGRRLKRFNTLETGVGGAVAVLSGQVDDLTRTLAIAQETAAHSAAQLTDLTERAAEISRQLELQMASLHDIPGQPAPAAHKPVEPQREPVPDQPVFVRHTNGAGR